MEIKEFYLKHYKKLFLIPVLLVAIALAVLINQYAKTGDIINKDVSLSGGITATVYTEKAVDVIELEKILNNKLEDTTARKLSEFGSDKQIGIVIETSDTKEDILKKELESYIGIKLEDENYSVEEIIFKDSRFVNEGDRELIFQKSKKCQEDKIIITHGTMTMPLTAKYLGQKKLEKTIVLLGAAIPGNKENSDALFNLGLAFSAVQLLPKGVYVAMNGKIFSWDNVKKNLNTGFFEKQN